MDNEVETQYHFRISSSKAVDRNVRDCPITVFCLNCDCVLIISLYRGFSSLYREYRYIEDRYIEFLSHTFCFNFCRNIEYPSLYPEYRYIEDRYIGFYSRSYNCYCRVGQPHLCSKNYQQLPHKPLIPYK